MRPFAPTVLHNWRRSIRLALDADPDALLIRTDIANAFNALRRDWVLQTLLDCNEDLGRCHFAWLSRPSIAMAPAEDGTRTALRTQEGIPQGDPLSSLAFAISMGPLLSDMGRSGLAVPFAFADDVMLVASPTAGSASPFQVAGAFTSLVALPVTPRKLALWDRLARPEVETLIHCHFPEAVVSAEGSHPVWPPPGGPCG